MKIEWTSSDSHVLLNPAYSTEDQNTYKQILSASSLTGHIWLATSGSTAFKWVGLSKEALLTSAQAVNQHLESTASDQWVSALPFFHVGGLSVWARGYLSGAAVSEFKLPAGKWQCLDFCKFIETVSGTLTSLVPTQLYDLVHLEIKPPKSLRAVIIGGGKLVPELYYKAVQLGWPLLPSYGLTECASQVATADLGSWKNKEYPSFTLLSHMQVKQQNERLAFKSPSLLSSYAYFENKKIHFLDPKVEGWFVGEDRGEVMENYLKIWGRTDSLIKIGGESVDLAHLECHFQAICLQMKIKQEMTLVAMPDSRLGHAIHLAVVGCSSAILTPVIESFCLTVLPFERIRAVHHLPFLPKSALFKIIKKELIQLINATRS
jgi:o-succinylbenzoate---CoA ligase